MLGGYAESRVRSLRRVTSPLIVAFLLGACGEETGPARTFLLRFPADFISRPHTSLPTYTAVRDDATGASITFEWEAAPGATSYEMVFWRAVAPDSMDQHRVDFDNPAFTIPVVSEPVIVPFNPADPDDERTLAVIQHEQTLKGLAELMAAAGLPAGDTLYFLWSVYAEGKGERWRSPENHRIKLQLVVPSP